MSAYFPDKALQFTNGNNINAIPLEYLLHVLK